MRKVLILADAGSIHTKRWACAIADEGCQVKVISYTKGQMRDDIEVITLQTPKLLPIAPTAPLWSRFHYLFGLSETNRVIEHFQPDIVHAFYATSYGFLAARCRAKQFFVSIWGQDITVSPKKLIPRLIIKKVLRQAEKIFCTSDYLIRETLRYTSLKDKLYKIPFGIDVELFHPAELPQKREAIVIGSTKSLETYYGLEKLISAFGILKKRRPDLPLKLLLLGNGSQRQNLLNRIKELNLEDSAHILEGVNHSEIPAYLQTMDIFVIPSVIAEAFGVAALEASACGVPLVGSNIGGIPEVIQHELTGFLVAPNDITALADALEKLACNPKLRNKFGEAGVTFVRKHYIWKNNVRDLLSHYR